MDRTAQSPYIEWMWPYRDLPPAILQRLRQERLSQIPQAIQESLPMSPDHLWDLAFQCTTHPNQEWISPDVQKRLETGYQGWTVQELLPRYIGVGYHWGAVVSPRVLGPTLNPTAHIEQWFISKPEDMPEMFTAIQEHWPFPSTGIVLPIHPDHRCIPWLPATIRLVESSFVMNWGNTPPSFNLPKHMEPFSVRDEKDMDGWWPAFRRILQHEQQPVEAEACPGWIDQLCEEIARCQQEGGIVNIYDATGFGGHISWNRISDLDLLIPECYQISYMLVRQDLRRRGIGKYLCHLAATRMALDAIPLVCTRVHSENHASRNMLENVGGQRIMDVYIVS